MTTAAAPPAATNRRRRMAAAAASMATVAVAAPIGVVVIAIGGAPPDPVELAALTGIPPIALAAYQRGALEAPTLAPSCVIAWPVLAGVGQVETGHGTFAGAVADAAGTVSPAIVGPPTSVGDSDGGALDGDAGGDRAVGPMQFMPGTWAGFGQDANGDGRADPQNLFDAALAAALYLCGEPAVDLSDDEARRAALLRYNHSAAYVAAVLRWVDYYEQVAANGEAVAGPPTGTIVSVDGIEVDQSIAAPLGSLLAAAEAAGVNLAGGGYRSAEEQIALRQANCGTSQYAVYEMPPSQCSPPTARPGESLHEQGLAIDFTCAGALITSSASPCFVWLAANAAAYGLYNLSSEPWHWSTTGR